MPFKKGQSGNPGGRPKGAKNRISINNKVVVNSFLGYLMADGYERFKKELSLLSGKDYCSIFLGIVAQINQTSNTEEEVAMIILDMIKDELNSK